MSTQQIADTHYYAGLPGTRCQHWRCRGGEGWQCAACGHYLNRGQVKHSEMLHDWVCNANTGHNRPVGKRDTAGRTWQGVRTDPMSSAWQYTAWHAIPLAGERSGYRLVYRLPGRVISVTGWHLYEKSATTPSGSRLTGYAGATLAVALKNAADRIESAERLLRKIGEA